MTEKGIEHNVACSRNLHCLNSLWFVTKWVPSIDTYLNWRWRNVSLAVRHFLACSYNLCSLLSVCDVIGLFLAQARPTDDCHLPSIHMAHERCTRTGVVMCVVYNVYGAACYTDQHVRTMHMHARVM